MMSRRSITAFLCGTALAIAGAIGTLAAEGDDYPSRTITLLVPFPPGGSSDIVMRLVAHKVAESIKQTIIIDNRPGGSGNVAAMAIKNAPARRVFADDGPHRHPCHQSLALHRFGVRPDQGLRADHRADLVQQHSRRSGGESGPDDRRPGRARQDEAEGPQLWLAGRWHRRAPARRIAGQACRREAGACALSRHRARSHRHGGGTHGHAVRVLHLHGRAHRKRKAAHARHRRHATPSAHPRRADHVRGWLSRGPDAAVVRPVRTRRHARAGGSQAQRRVRQGAG
jgi:hypothetical protein